MGNDAERPWPVKRIPLHCHNASLCGTLSLERVPVKLSLLQVALWAANSVLNVVLVVVLFTKRRWRLVPWLTAWMSYSLLYALLCFLSFWFGSKQSYRVIYWGGALGDFLLQIAVVFEIAQSALKRDGKWVEGAKVAILPFAVAGLVVATVLTATITPATTSFLDELLARSSLFSTVLVCFLFFAVVRATQQLGLDWRSYTARESLGLTVWTVGAFATDSFHTYWRTAGHFGALEHIRMVIFQGVLLFWCIAFWLPEPGGLPMPESVKGDYLRQIQR